MPVSEGVTRKVHKLVLNGITDKKIRAELNYALVLALSCLPSHKLSQYKNKLNCILNIDLELSFEFEGVVPCDKHSWRTLFDVWRTLSDVWRTLLDVCRTSPSVHAALYRDYFSFLIVS